MRKFIDTKGLKFKMWSYFTLFSVFIFVMLWLFQIIFLNTYYESMKISEVRKIIKNVSQSDNEENYEEFLFQTAFNNGVIIQLYDSNSRPLLGGGNPAANRFAHPQSREYKELFEALKKKEKGDIISYATNMRANMRMVVAGTKVASSSNDFYLMVYAPLAPISSTTEVLKNQLLLVTGILLILSFIISYFIAKRISNPLVKITSSANRLAKGDYEVKFEKGGYTEINHLSDTLNFATGELSKTDSLRRDLIANVSHDLKTPLTIIKSYSEMIRDISGENKEKRDAHTKVIIDEADKMSALVDDILALSKAESGTYEYNFTRFNITDVVKSIINRFSSLAEKEGYSIQFCDTSAFFVCADEAKIGQVIHNLINNAVNYTGEDKKVIISIKKHEKNVRFSVTDTGEGIKENEIPRIWERYWRSSYGRSRAAAGTGIGLSIVKTFLTAHNADFGVESKPGEGSTFWFELPEDI
ncbi:MAG: HAMP domain-containing histidine kinase [Clostridia bacterium]|nr:HAMP domain-containing histidine kinase [Clostridia bacterium]